MRTAFLIGLLTSPALAQPTEAPAPSAEEVFDEAAAEDVAEADDGAAEGAGEAAAVDDPDGNDDPGAIAEADEDDEGPAGEPADAQAAFARGDYAAAQAGWAAQVAQAPDDARLRYRQAAAAALAGALPVARDAAAHAERLDPGNEAAAELAAAAHKLAIRKAEPQTAAADLLATARRALADGRLRTAERLAARGLAAAARQPDSAAPVAALARIRGQALVALGQLRPGSEALKAAAGAGQRDAALWTLLAEVSQREGNSAAAQAYLILATDAGQAPPPPAAPESTEDP